MDPTINTQPDRSRVDWHQQYVDAQMPGSKELEFKPPRTWAGWARDVAPTVGWSALAVGTTAYGAMCLRDNMRNTAAKNVALRQPLAGKIVQPLDNPDQCMRLPHAPKYRPRSIDRRMAAQAMAGPPIALKMPPPQNSFQRGVLKAQDAAVDAAAAAGAGAAIGALFGGPIGLVAGILAGGAIGAIGGEMRGR